MFDSTQQIKLYVIRQFWVHIVSALYDIVINYRYFKQLYDCV